MLNPWQTHRETLSSLFLSTFLHHNMSRQHQYYLFLLFILFLNATFSTIKGRRLIDPGTEETNDLNVQVLSETSSSAPRARGLHRSLVGVARSGPSPGDGHKHVEDNAIAKRKTTN
ncbi:unnamed protein product [Lactuca virosa]|uniref:Uncharacterized protein n=1 Tax=Lactuca virosa TaxID=75947 RepID=A0AAU9P4H4_9ASTR|nr:unnamed protein product [Lactuca virosa]